MVAAGGLRAGRRLFWESTDYQFIQREAPDCDVVVPELGNGTPVAEGRFYSYEDDALVRRVAFLGTDAKQQLFGSRPALGQTIRVGQFPYTVIGVMRRKEQNSSYDGMDVGKVFIPFSAMLRDFPNKPPATPHSIDRLIVTPKSYAQYQACLWQVRRAARARAWFRPQRQGSRRHLGHGRERQKRAQDLRRHGVLHGGRRSGHAVPRRHRRDERHARVRARTDARNRAAQGRRRAAAIDPIEALRFEAGG
jgi:hypothetical protein